MESFCHPLVPKTQPEHTRHTKILIIILDLVNAMDNVSIDIVDFHSHILPGADHGSSSVETSLSQLNLAHNNGVTRIIATPHFYPHRHTLEQFLKRRENAWEQLSSSISEDLPTVKLGAEVLLCQGLENFKGIENLTLNGTNYMLLELPFSDFRNEYCDTVASLLKSGFDIILAHVDRYPKENIERLIDVGVSKLQLNAESLAGFFKPKHLLSWASDNMVVALGSDIHGADEKAYKRFIKAKKALADSLSYVEDASNNIWNLVN